MITVSIAINGVVIAARSAVNITPLCGDKEIDENSPNIYKLDTGAKIIHTPKEGAVTLAKRMLDTLDI